ncbi:hypothetical protein BGW39_005171 [Mortierella sp. 14UC]|nr:hypothetical protein BGW39_005171 [Mortierella sp. 14UC]
MIAGFQYLQQQSVLYRDVHLGNFLLTTEKESKISDFGRKHNDEKFDVLYFDMVLYELLAGCGWISDKEETFAGLADDLYFAHPKPPSAVSDVTSAAVPSSSTATQKCRNDQDLPVENVLKRH